LFYFLLFGICLALPAASQLAHKHIIVPSAWLSGAWGFPSWLSEFFGVGW
jgi:hypothetical protein